MTGTPELNTQIYEAAVDWFLRMRDGENDVAARAELTAWLRRSPEHVRAYLEIASIWTEARGVRAETVGDARSLIERASAEGNVYELRSPTRDSSVAENMPPNLGGAAAPVRDSSLAEGKESNLRGAVARRSALARVRTFATAASVLLAAVTLALATWYYVGVRTYSTETGEHRTVTLTDGSRVQLNSRSTIRIRFTDEARVVDLSEGQALFHVAKNPDRPFIVRSDEAQVRAVGTAFDVYRRDSGTLVTVVEGKVLVARRPGWSGSTRESADPRAPPEGGVPAEGGSGSGASVPTPEEQAISARRDGAPVELVAGEQVLVTARTLAEPTKVNVSTATAWTQQKLVFESASLAEVVREFNRYNARPLIVSGSELEDFRVSAVFPSTDPGSLISFLRAQPGIRVQETDDAILISASASSQH